jgi:PEGA domain
MPGRAARHLKLTALLLTCIAGEAWAETECKDCWSDQCSNLSGLMPKCRKAKVKATVKAGAAAPAKGAPREKACPGGREKTADTAGHCCWVGQVWADDSCRGMPSRCPAGFRVDEAQEACELAPCEADRVRMGDGATCCYPGQVASKGACRGRPKACPEHFQPKGETCSDEAYRASLARTFPVHLESTPPGATVSLVGRSCTAPCDLEVPRGLATGEALLEGFERQSLVINVTGERPQSLKVSMAQENGLVSVESVPVGATVLVDGVSQNAVTPFVVQTSPGSHRVVLQKPGYLPVEVAVELKLGSNPAIVRTLEVPPAPPPLPAPGQGPPAAPAAGVAPAAREAVLAQLADLQVDADHKRELLAARHPADDLTPFLDAVAPPDLRSELCAAYAARVRGIEASAELRDSFGDPVKGVLIVDGREVGALPYRGALPACATRFQAREADGVAAAEWRPPEGRLSAAGPNLLEFRLEGRRIHVSLSGTGEYGAFLFAQPAGLSGDLPDQMTAFGGRIDYWGKLLHVSVAVKASTLFRQLFAGSAAASWAVAADLYVGLLVASQQRPARVWLAVDVGLWNVLCPSARLSLALSIFDIGFITIYGDAHYVSDFLVKDTAGTLASRTLLQSVMLSAGASIGVGF